jgi:hypothetical protein
MAFAFSITLGKARLWQRRRQDQATHCRS